MYNLCMELKRSNIFKILKIFLIALLVVALVTSTILVTKIGDEKPQGLLAKESLDNMPKLIYSETSVSNFKELMGIYLKKIIGLSSEVRTNFSLITNALLEVFQSAQISGDKLDKFSKYLDEKSEEKSGTQSELAMFLEMMYSEVQKTDSEGNLVFDANDNPVMVKKFDPEGNMYKFFQYEKYQNTIDEIMQKTGITLHEIGKIGYYSTLFFSNENTKVQFEKLGEKGFTTLFVDIIFSLQITRNFLDEGGSLPEARMIGELLYQTGSDLKQIIDTLGVTFLANLIAPEDPFNIFSAENMSQIKEDFSKIENSPSEVELLSMIEDVEELVEIISSSRESIEFLILLLKNILLEVKNLSFENFVKFSDQYEVNRIKYEKIAFAMFASQINRGIELTKGESKFDSNEKIVENISNLLTRNKSFRGGLVTEEEKNAYCSEVGEKIEGLLNDIERIALIGKDIASLETFNNMPSNDRLELDNFVIKYKGYDYSYLEGTTDFTSVLFVTVMLELYVNSYNLILAGVQI